MSFFDGLWGKIGGKQKNADGLFRKIEKKNERCFSLYLEYDFMNFSRDTCFHYNIFISQMVSH